MKRFKVLLEQLLSKNSIPIQLGNGHPLKKALDVPPYIVVDMTDEIKKRSTTVVPIPYELSHKKLDHVSSRHDLAIGRPCFSSGNFYSRPEEWLDCHDSCVTIGLQDGMTDRRVSGRWSGAKDGEGRCWIAVDLGYLAFVDEVSIDFEAAWASVYRVSYEKDEPLQLQSDGSIGVGSDFVTIGDFDGGEGVHTTGTFTPVLTRAIRIELVEPRWTGSGFSMWSLSVLGTSTQLPIYSYYCSTTSKDLETWWKCKIIGDVESKLRKKSFIYVGEGGMPHDHIHEDKVASRDERMEIMKNCEAVIVMFSNESALDDDSSNHVIDDVRCAIKMGKPIIPIIVEKVTFSDWEEEGKLLWPPLEPTLRSAFEDLIFIDFSTPDEYSRGLGFLNRTLLG
jgi:hypothetical protein